MFNRIQMYMEWLRTDPVNFVISMLYTVVVVLVSLILHECAHGYVAYRCGDPTAKMMGRLSLNPLRHLDPVGTVCMFVLGFGWAKPVPVNPRYFRNYRRDDFLVSIAGIVTNLTLFLISTIGAVILNRVIWTQELLDIVMEEFGSLEMLVNINHGWSLSFGGDYLSAYHIYAEGHQLIEPFREFMQVPWLIAVQRLLLMLSQINLALAVFNLLPVPPLDGYHLVNDTLLKGRLQLNHNTFRIAQMILLVLCFTGVFSELLTNVNTFISTHVIRLLLRLTGGL